MDTGWTLVSLSCSFVVHMFHGWSNWWPANQRLISLSLCLCLSLSLSLSLCLSVVAVLFYENTDFVRAFIFLSIFQFFSNLAYFMLLAYLFWFSPLYPSFPVSRISKCVSHTEATSDSPQVNFFMIGAPWPLAVVLYCVLQWEVNQLNVR